MIKLTREHIDKLTQEVLDTFIDTLATKLDWGDAEKDDAGQTLWDVVANLIEYHNLGKEYVIRLPEKVVEELRGTEDEPYQVIADQIIDSILDQAAAQDNKDTPSK